jgi:Fur family ferric uptake transcriptional regulator
MPKTTEIEAIAQTRAILLAAGLRTTAARTAVIRWLQAAKSPATHAEIAVDLVPLGFDKATVFRNLNDLAEAGLVTRTELGDHVWRFELRDASHADRGQHPHFVCIDCGTVTCLHDIDMPAASKKSISKVGEVTEILMRGHCVSCS